MYTMVSCLEAIQDMHVFVLSQLFIIWLHVANCGNPTDQVDNTLVDIIGYTDPAVEGSNITIDCSSGYARNGAFNAVCLENGNWEPELKDISLNCSGYLA